MVNVTENSVQQQVTEAFQAQRKAVLTRRSEPIKIRKRRLLALRQWIKENRAAIHEAIYSDFRKPAAEVDGTEIFPGLDEIKLAVDNLDRWSKPKKIDAPLTMLGTRSEIIVEPKGVCLIIAPWNYPFNLCVGPLASALAAGNTVILKPSEVTPYTSALIKRMCSEIFQPDEVMVFEGGLEVSQALLSLPFDHIFFTGSPAVGKVVMKAAAEHLTSVTLELGGKSPTIVSQSARVKEAAQRIAVAKFINNGQTCIAPDYILAHTSVASALMKHLKEQATQLFSQKGSFSESPHYARIVNEKHFDRLTAMVHDAVDQGATLEMSGDVERSDKYIHPIILSNVSPTARLMDEEIFGPILPVLTYESIDEALEIINTKPKPLALYYFGTTGNELARIKSQTSAGGMCVNDCAIQFLNLNIPFGGVNNSGMGKSHGYYGFLAFSNEKPVLRQRHGLTSVGLLYPPYTKRVKRFMTWLLKLV